MGGVVDTCSEQEPELLTIRSRLEAKDDEFFGSAELKNVFINNFDEGFNLPKSKSCDEVLEQFGLTIKDLEIPNN